MPALLNRLLSQATHGQGAWVLTLNTEMLSRFARDPAYKGLVAQADIITADGMPLVWSSRLRGPHQAIAERTTGVDLVNAFLSLSEVPRFAVIGGVDPGSTVARYGASAQAACGYLFSGMVDLSTEQAAMFVTELRGRRVQVLFLALGVPKQDLLALKIRKAMPELIVAGVGGTFEILGPQGGRAPRWMQKSGLEWLYRLVREPRRLWRRYVVQYPAGIRLLIGDTLKARSGAG